MNKVRTKIYFFADEFTKSFIYTGINFKEFSSFLGKPLDNILLLKSSYYGNKFYKNFELLEGKNEITNLSNENIYEWGEFCFIDYSKSDAVKMLSEIQISELLYIAHMHKYLSTPFVNCLKNRFVYLSQDDGFYCKLYCKEIDEVFGVLNKKINRFVYTNFNVNPSFFNAYVQNQLYSHMKQGLFMELNDIEFSNRVLKIPIYIVGEISDMDNILNNTSKIINSTNLKKYLVFKCNEWIIE